MSGAAEIVLLRVDRAAAHHTAHPRHLHPPLDLKYVQARLEADGDTVPLIDGWLEPFSVDACVARVLALQPRFAVIRAVTWCLQESLAVARALRSAGVCTIAVGQQVAHVRRCPHPLWSRAYTHAVAGEPEQAVPELIRALRAGRPVFDESVVHQVTDPDRLAAPRYSAAELACYPFPFPVRTRPVRRWGYLLTAWGCPRPCRHCTEIVRRSVGRNLRERTVGAVVDEMLGLRDAGAQFLCIDDDSLPVHRSRFVALCEEMVRRGVALPWMANARPDELDSERVEAAAAAGAVLFKVGVDSGAPRVIERLGKAADGAAWVAATESAFSLLDRHGIGSVALFMVGMPEETLAEALQSLALARRIRPDYLQVQIFRAYPDIALWAELPPAGRVAADEYHYAAPQSNCSRIAAGELAALQHRFYREFYLRPGYALRHLRHFWRHYLPGIGPAAPVGFTRVLDYLLSVPAGARPA